MPSKLSAQATSALQALIDAYPTASHPGTVVGVVNRDGEVLFLEATGERDLASGAPCEKDTVFAIFSCTKLITSIAAMQVVEAGKVGLDEPVDNICPELANKDVVISSTETTLETRKAKTPITLRMLLTHTAGFTYPWYSVHITRWAKQAGQENVFRPMNMVSIKRLAAADAKPLVHEPGTRFDYSVSMDWVGKVVERVSGMTVYDFCQKNIFDPLGMQDSTWDLDMRPDLVPRLATLHGWDKKTDSFQARDWPYSLHDPQPQSGGGGLMTTVPDYLRALATILNGGVGPTGTRILQPETVRLMFTDQVADLEDKGVLATTPTRVETTNGGVADAPLELLPGCRKGWGMGHLLNLDDIPGGRRANSAEWAGVGNLFWVADPTSQIGFAVFNDVLPYGLPAFVELHEEVEKVLFAAGAVVIE